MAPTEGLEPSTHGLTVRRSLPTELRGHCSNFFYLRKWKLVKPTEPSSEVHTHMLLPRF